MLPMFQEAVEAGELVEAWGCLQCYRAYIVPCKPVEFIMTELAPTAPNGHESPYCHFCETNHSGERRVTTGIDGGDLYCPGPLLEDSYESD